MKTLGNLFHFNEKDFVVAIVGRMVYDKGVSYIIKAINLISDANIKFLFIGDGPYLQNIKEEFRNDNRIIALGARKDILQLLCGCDLFLFATLHENLSNALLEAMALGLPVVATDVGGNRDVVKDSYNGFLISPKNELEMAEKIRLIKNNKELRRNFSEASKEIIKSEFSQKVIYNKLDEVYEMMLQK